MKKTIFLIVSVVAFMLQIHAQQFAPVGAIWHYTQWTVNPGLTSFKTIESISDTVINGIECRKMIEVERYLDTIGVDYRYMYSENDSVFFFKDNGFHLLYDFGAEEGDTVILDYFMTFEGPLKMIIDSTATILVNNEERKIQYITCGDGLVIEFGDHVIEGIGCTYFMFPTLDGNLEGPLRCYQDNDLGLFLSPYHSNYGWNHLDCEEIVLSIFTIETSDGIKVYPNPATDILNIEYQTPIMGFGSTVVLYNTCGHKVKEITVPTGNQKMIVDVKDWDKGMYFLKMTVQGKTVGGCKVMVD